MNTTAPSNHPRIPTPTVARGPAPALGQGKAVRAITGHDEQELLLEACPGAGKTIPALRLIHHRISLEQIGEVIVVAPTCHLARQWAAAAHRVGLRLAAPNFDGIDLPRGHSRRSSSPTRACGDGLAVPDAHLYAHADARDRRRAAPHG